MSKIRSNQGGAILTFIVIAAILVAVTLSAIYFVQQRGIQARRDQAIAAADKQASNQKATQAASDAARRASDAAKLAAAQQAASSSTPNPGSPNTSKAAELPTTGPSDGLIAMIALGSVVVSTSYYVSSRRALARSL